MSNTEEFGRIRKLYAARQFPAVLTAVEAILTSDPTNEVALGWKAWCYYQLGEYAESMEAALLVGDDQFGLKCLLHLYAYQATGFRDREKMRAVAERIVDKVAVASALAICARADKDASFLTHDSVFVLVMSFLGNTDLNYAHLLQNAARVYIDWNRGDQDYVIAMGLLEVAIFIYGDDGDENMNHRAAANHWLSYCAEKLGMTKIAEYKALRSRDLWRRQVEAASDNGQYTKNLASAEANVTRLQTPPA